MSSKRGLYQVAPDIHTSDLASVLCELLDT